MTTATQPRPKTKAAAAQLPDAAFSELTVDRLVIPYPDGRAAFTLALQGGVPTIAMHDPSGTERMRLTLGTEERGDDGYNPSLRMLSLHNRLQTDFLSDGVRSESKHGVAWFGLNGRGIPYVNLDAKTNT